MANYYSNSEFPYVERAILAEDIKLPTINDNKKLTRGFFYNKIAELVPGTFFDGSSSSDISKEYKLAYNEIKNITAKFNVPILFPNVSTTNQSRKPKTTGFTGANMRAGSYSNTSTINLTIPKYMVMQFVDQTKACTIPKGTEFLVACVGGEMEIEKMRIIGLFTL